MREPLVIKSRCFYAHTSTHTHTLSLSLLLCLFQKLCEVVAVVAIGGLPEPLSHRVIHDIHSAFRDTHTHTHQRRKSGNWPAFFFLFDVSCALSFYLCASVDVLYVCTDKTVYTHTHTHTHTHPCYWSVCMYNSPSPVPGETHTESIAHSCMLVQTCG